MADSGGHEHSEKSGKVRQFFHDPAACAGFFAVLLLFLTAVCAPLLVNGQPLLLIEGSSWSSPMLRDFFAPSSQEKFVEVIFNYLLLVMVPAVLICLFRKRIPFRKTVFAVILIAAAVPFVLTQSRMDKTNWRDKAASLPAGIAVVFAPVPYGPFETSSDTYGKPCRQHWFGTDHVGRDVFARMVYGARVSLAVGIFATGLSMFLGTLIGLISGYFGGRVDLAVQRIVEIVICFPAFLLLLILMSIFLDYQIRQSILLVIAVLGLTSWPGLCRLVRGEVLKQRSMAYISACESLGVSKFRILFRHLLPNVSAPLFVSFAFEIAGAILAENSLSFLGFGVQDPTASWGELLQQAFTDPVTYWNLMLWPGLAVFLSVTAFNFVADGLRKVLDVKAA